MSIGKSHRNRGQRHDKSYAQHLDISISWSVDKRFAKTSRVAVLRLMLEESASKSTPKAKVAICDPSTPAAPSKTVRQAQGKDESVREDYSKTHRATSSMKDGFVFMQHKVVPDVFQFNDDDGKSISTAQGPIQNI
jgi:hypothetical protein